MIYLDIVEFMFGNSLTVVEECDLLAWVVSVTIVKNNIDGKSSLICVRSHLSEELSVATY